MRTRNTQAEVRHMQNSIDALCRQIMSGHAVGGDDHDLVLLNGLADAAECAPLGWNEWYKCNLAEIANRATAGAAD